MTSSDETTVFVDTNLNTHLALIVSDSVIVSDLKRRIVLEHHQCFPAIGSIKIDGLKVKRRGIFYNLGDSMRVKGAFAAAKESWFVLVDASRLEQNCGVQNMDKHKAGDQIALPWVTDNHSIDQGSPSMSPKIVPVDPKVSNVGQITVVYSRNDCQDYTEKDRPLFNKEISSKKRTRAVQNDSLPEDASGSGPSVKKKRKTQKKEPTVKASENLGSEKTIISNNKLSENSSVHDQVATVVPSGVVDTGAETLLQNAGASETVPEVSVVLEKNIPQEVPSEVSQKDKDKELAQKTVAGSEIPFSLMRYASESGPSVKKKRRTQKKEATVKASENMGNENTIISNNKLSVSSSVHDQVATVAPSGVVDMGAAETLLKNAGASETVPEVSVGLEKNIPQEVPSEVSQKDKDKELAQKTVAGSEIPSSLMRTSDCEPDTTALSHQKGEKSSTQHKAAEKEVVATSPIKTQHNINMDATNMFKKDVGSTVNESAGLETDNHEKDKEMSLIQKPEVKLPGRKKSVKKLLVKLADNIVSETSSVVLTTTVDEKINDETKNDKVSLSNAEKNEALEKTLTDDVTMLGAETIKPTEVVVETSKPTEVVVETSKPTEIMVETSKKDLKDVVRSRKTKKDVISATKTDAATVMNKEKLLPHSELKESQDITSIDVLHVDHGSKDDIVTNNDAEMSKAEKTTNQVNAEGIDEKSEKQNEKMDDKKLNRKKRKAKKSANNGEGSMPTVVSVPSLNDEAIHGKMALLHAAVEHVDQMRGKNEHVSDEGLVKKAKKNHKSSVTAPADLPSKRQFTEPEAEPEKSQSLDAEMAKAEKTTSQVNAAGIDEKSEKQNEKMDDKKVNRKKRKAKKSANNGEGSMSTVVSVPPLNDEAIDHKMDLLQAAVEHVDHHTSKNLIVSEASKNKDDVSNEVNISKDGSHKIDFLKSFSPGKDTARSVKEKRQKKTKEPSPIVSRNDSAMQSQKIASKNENKKAPNDVVKGSMIPNTDQFKTPKMMSKIDASRTIKPAHANKAHNKPSAESLQNQKSNKQQPTLSHSSVKNVQKSAPVKKSPKSLLNKPETIFGGDSDESSADENAAANSDSSTRTPSGSSSSGDSATSIKSGRKGSAADRLMSVAKDSMNSQSKSKKGMTMADLLRSSIRFKRAKVTASQRDTESQSVDFVPDSQPY